MPSNPSVIQLSALNGSNGFKINGEVADDRSGNSVASAGDVNSDGFADLIIGAYAGDPNGNSYSGASYVVFGKASGFAATLDLSTLDGNTGFQISGEAAGDYSGRSVASAGDVNGDGFADLIIGASRADANGNASGASYVVFGKASGFATTLDLSTLDGNTGFQISGEAATDASGASVASAGDVNGDGFDDLIIGALFADANGSSSGASYVVFGKASGFAATLDLSTLDGNTGFQISGEAAFDYSGHSVASAGDVNGDGFADLIIGADFADPNGSASGASYVVFGKASGFAATLDLSTLDGNSGFQINGEAADDFSGRSVASAGDVNGDGFADLIIGANRADPNGSISGASYVVFGKASGFAATLDLSTLDGSTGFQISGEAASDVSGASVASAGDVNGDGFADLIIGANGADPNGSASGASYVVFGKASGFAATLDLSTLDGNTGFQISGEAAGDYSGRSVASAGDVNGDGFADLIIGAEFADPNGSASGASYVVFGRATGTLNRSFSEGDDLIGGGDWDDVLRGLGGVDVMGGGDGDDTLEGGADSDTLDGGDGDDTLIGGSGADILQGSAGDDTILGGSGSDYVYHGSGNDTLDGGSGLDTLDGEAFGSIAITVNLALGTLQQDGSDVVSQAINFENVKGGSGNDVLSGTSGANEIYGEGGNDTLNGGLDGDLLQGDGGDDTYVLGADATGVDTVNETTGIDTITSTISRSLVDYALIEKLTLLGSSVINGTGNNLANTITGNSAKNILAGGDGADMLIGGKGNDELSGGTGADQFVFNTTLSASTNVDKISTLSSLDQIVVDNDIFTGLGTAFDLNEFRSIASGTSFASVDATDNIIYLKSTGDLYYDRDGSGTTYSAVKFADLAGGTTVNFSHFLLVE